MHQKHACSHAAYLKRSLLGGVNLLVLTFLLPSGRRAQGGVGQRRMRQRLNLTRAPSVACEVAAVIRQVGRRSGAVCA